jgi:myosin heavy subunit
VIISKEARKMAQAAYTNVFEAMHILGLADTEMENIRQTLMLVLEIGNINISSKSASRTEKSKQRNLCFP